MPVVKETVPVMQIVRLSFALGLAVLLGACDPQPKTETASAPPAQAQPASPPAAEAPAVKAEAPAQPAPAPVTPDPAASSPAPAASTASAATAAAEPAAPPADEKPATTSPPAGSDDRIVITTEHGRIIIDLFEEDAPKHSENFKKLAREGFYNGLSFHRVIEGVMAQAGEPQGTGPRGVSYTIPAEIKRPHRRGSVGAARRFLNNPTRESNGSQFYICFTAQPRLDGEYTVFGQVIEGMDVVDKLKRGDGASGVMVPPNSGDKLLKVEVVPR
jgi:cyclophilin family peptidyl-prolyl cis-trans isomerase